MTYDTTGIDEVQVPVLDVRVTPRTAAQVADAIERRAVRPQLILNHNLHSVYFFHRFAWFRRLYSNSDMIVIDGWPVLKLASRGAHVSMTHRVGSTDWIQALWNRPAPVPLRVFVLGGSKEVNEAAVQAWRRARPDDTVVGNTGYMNGADELTTLAAIHAFEPHLLLVGMGMPMQESFLSRHQHRLPNAHIATVGGAIDYIAVPQRLSPRWLGRLGLEWLWRLLHDPRRLAGRYLVEPVKLIAVLAQRRLRNEDEHL
jgi:N-acetylglucosaminyldiphosphoundecaprenol N-acetyl-beta-D-mannosaminyltransferase